METSKGYKSRKRSRDQYLNRWHTDFFNSSVEGKRNCCECCKPLSMGLMRIGKTYYHVCSEYWKDHQKATRWSETMSEMEEEMKEKLRKMEHMISGNREHERTKRIIDRQDEGISQELGDYKHVSSCMKGMCTSMEDAVSIMKQNFLNRARMRLEEEERFEGMKKELLELEERMRTHRTGYVGLGYLSGYEKDIPIEARIDATEEQLFKIYFILHRMHEKKQEMIDTDDERRKKMIKSVCRRLKSDKKECLEEMKERHLFEERKRKRRRMEERAREWEEIGKEIEEIHRKNEESERKGQTKTGEA